MKSECTRGRWLPLLVLLLTCLATAGCQDASVVQDVSQRQANSIVALLSEHGISAEAQKGVGGRAQYTVQVKRSNYTQAVSLLEKNDLPKAERPSFSELVEPRGLLPNSREAELLRLDHAVAVEIEEVLKDLPGVKSVKVLVRKQSVEVEGQLGVSVLLVAEPGAVIDQNTIREVLRRALPGIEDSKFFITVQSSELEHSDGATTVGVQNDDSRVVRLPLRGFLKLWRVPEEDYAGISMTLIGCMVLMGALGFLVGHWYSILQTTRRAALATSRELITRSPSNRSAPVDRARKDLSDN